METTTSLAEYKILIDKALENYNIASSPKELYEPISYILSIGGKRMRPIILMMAHELFGGNPKEVVNQALAIEIFHNFTLVHDDIMDNAPVRRGQPTVHTKWNENIGILSGDVMFVLAYKLICESNPDNLKEVLDTFNKTAIGVCEGQQFDMNFELTSDVTIDDYIQMIRLKTAVLLGGGMQIGAILANASADDIIKINAFGENLGIAFQLQDDILDVYGDPDKFGKQVGGDIISNKKTYLLLKALEIAPEGTKQHLINVLKTTDNKSKVLEVTEIYNQLNIKGLSLEKVDFYFNLAMKNLDEIGVSEEQKQPLKSLAYRLMMRES